MTSTQHRPRVDKGQALAPSSCSALSASSFGGRTRDQTSAMASGPSMSVSVGVSAPTTAITPAVDATAGYNRTACNECQRRKQKVG